MKKQKPKLSDLCSAYSELLLTPAVISQIGQAVYSGKGLFLYGPPGTGKTYRSAEVNDTPYRPQPARS